MQSVVSRNIVIAFRFLFHLKLRSHGTVGVKKFQDILMVKKYQGIVWMPIMKSKNQIFIILIAINSDILSILQVKMLVNQIHVIKSSF